MIYPNLMKLDYDNIRTRTVSVIDGTETAEQKTEIELFEEFFEKQNGRPMSGEQRSFSEGLRDETLSAGSVDSGSHSLRSFTCSAGAS